MNGVMGVPGSVRIAIRASSSDLSGSHQERHERQRKCNSARRNPADEMSSIFS